MNDGVYNDFDGFFWMIKDGNTLVFDCYMYDDENKHEMDCVSPSTNKPQIFLAKKPYFIRVLTDEEIEKYF